jgi:basic amino acid/polyamine antiporter, APA family
MKDRAPGLARVLGLRDLIAIVFGTVIGSGVFIIPGTVLRQVGTRVDVALVVWGVGGVLSLLGALTYGELGAMKPEAGGLYVYIRDAFGSLPAFLYGWSLFFVIGSGSVAALAVASTLYLGELVPLNALGTRLVPLAMIAFCAFINVRGTRHSATLTTWTTVAKILAILGVTIALLVVGRAPGMVDAPPPAPLPLLALLSAAGLAMIATLWAYEGWQYVTFSAGEARDPQRTFPLGIVTGTAGVVALYLLANIAYIRVLGGAGVARSDRVAADAVGVALGPGAARAIAIVAEIAVFSALNSVVLTAPRVFYAMARDGVFFRRLAEVHPRFGTPAFAILTGAAWAMVLAASGTYEQLLTYVIFSGWIFYGLGALSVFWYRRYRADASRPFRVPGYPLTPALFVISALALVVNTIIGQPGRAAIGLGIVLLGAPVFYAWRRWVPSGDRDGLGPSASTRPDGA